MEVAGIPLKPEQCTRYCYTCARNRGLTGTTLGARGPVSPAKPRRKAQERVPQPLTEQVLSEYDELLSAVDWGPTGTGYTRSGLEDASGPMRGLARRSYVVSGLPDG